MSIATFLTSSKNDLSKAIAKATKSAVEVAGREHVKAARHERVGIFVTCLRQEVRSGYNFWSQATNKEVSYLQCKSLWHDAGVLVNTFPGYPCKLTIAEFILLKEIAMQSKSLYEIYVSEDTPESIQKEISSLKIEMMSVNLHVQHAVDVNRRAEELIRSLTETMEKVAS